MSAAGADSWSLKALVVGGVLVVAARYLTGAIGFFYVLGAHGGSSSVGIVLPAFYIVLLLLAGFVTGWLAHIRGGMHGLVVGAFARFVTMPFADSINAADLARYVVETAVVIAVCAVGGKLGQWLRG